MLLTRLFLAVLLLTASWRSAEAQQDLSNELAVGAWFGKAVPVNPATSPFPEVYMTPTFLADGTVVANDSHELTSRHTTSHGHWVKTGPNQIKAVFVWMNITSPQDSIPNGYNGAFKVTVLGSINPSNPDQMTGTVHPYQFPPGTDPLDSTNTGGVDVGIFNIAQLTRIKSVPSSTVLPVRKQERDLEVGSWYGSAFPVNPSTAQFPEVIMTPTFFGDGNLLANDSQGTTSHGNWVKTGPDSVKAVFIWINLAAPSDSIPSGYLGAVRITLRGYVSPTAPDEMTGTVSVLVFPPGTNPTDSTNTGSIDAGVFNIDKLRRIKTQPATLTQVGRDLSRELAVGSWYGRAVSVNPSTAVLPEVVMTPSFMRDGNLIANDSHEETNKHTTTHGDWVKTGENQMTAQFIWLNLAVPSDSIGNGSKGAFKILLTGTIDPANPDEMTGTVQATFFPPGTNPLDPANTGGVDVGSFVIVELRRIKAQPSARTFVVNQNLNPELGVGSWFGRAISANPKTAVFPEIFMTPTFLADGNLLANDSQIAASPHVTTHGTWVKTTPNHLKATFIAMGVASPADSIPNGYKGSLHILLFGAVNPLNPDRMTGTVHARFFPPGTDPLDPAHTGSVDLGLYNIISLKRIKADPFTPVVLGRDLSRERATGSWVGNATADNPGSALFPEVVLSPTFVSDGNLVVNDSQEGNLPHSTSKGDWVKTTDDSVRAVFIWMGLAVPADSIPSGFKNAVKVRLSGAIDPAKPDEMTGTFAVRLFPLGTDPTDPSDAGSTDGGTFTIDKLVRVKALPSDPTLARKVQSTERVVGSWFGRAVPVNPTGSPFPEVVMTPTFLSDGNVIANDSHEETNKHATSHGNWVQMGADSVLARFVWLNLAVPSDSIDSGHKGGVKVEIRGYINPATPNDMSGTVYPIVFPPGTDPLDSNNTGGISAGAFTIAQLRRIAADPEGPTAILEEENAAAPKTYSLSNAFPNPFNPNTTIRYSVPKTGPVQLTIYNMLGQQVRILVDGVQSAGTHQITWDGRNANGRGVSSGVYLYRLTAESFNQTKKMLLLK